MRAFQSVALIGSELSNLNLLVFIMNKLEATCKEVRSLAQYLGFLTNFSIFDSKLRLTKDVQSLIFQKFYKDIENLISLGAQMYST